MGTFAASLRTIGDVKSLAATIELADGRLRIIAGDTEIGSWPLSEIHLEEIPTGYRMAAEGEQILIEMKDPDSFATELKGSNKKRLGLKRAKPAKTEDEPRQENPTPTPPTPRVASAPAPAPVEQKPTQSVVLPPKTETKQKSSGWSARGLSFVDGTLAKAAKKLGPYLPEWVFTRAMFAIAFGALVLMLVLPGLVSIFLLIAGGLMIMFGAIVYSDTMLASRWLPGRTTPQHALLFGVAILMMGVLLGIIAN